MEPIGPYFLTSKAIAPTENGCYPFYQSEWLIPHETLRREFLRAEWALSRMDVLQHPWKAVTFKVWLLEFFFPSINSHHSTEEEVIGQHFGELGEIGDFASRSEDHGGILERMQITSVAAVTLAESVKELHPNSSMSEKDKVINQQHILVALMKDLKNYAFSHFEGEENTWPKIYRKHGEIKVRDLDTKIFKFCISSYEARCQFQLIFGSVLDQSGYTKCYPPGKYPKSLTCALQMDPWANEKVITEILDRTPWICRYVIFPMWQKAYVSKWKLMIESVAGDEDILQVKDTDDKCCNTGCWSIF